MVVLFMYKVLLYAMFEGFQHYGSVYGVACKDNNKGVRCSVVVTGGVGCDDDRLVCIVFVCGGWFKE